MDPLKILVLTAGALALSTAMAEVAESSAPGTSKSVASGTARSPVTPVWPVATSLKATLRIWAQRQGWPMPQFLTDADWPVDVPGTIPGSIEEALRTLAAGFSRAASRPRIEISGNHVIVVSEIGAE
jgi:hypothetical protein